jgi:hypothetical protein
MIVIFLPFRFVSSTGELETETMQTDQKPITILLHHATNNLSIMLSIDKYRGLYELETFKFNLYEMSGYNKKNNNNSAEEDFRFSRSIPGLVVTEEQIFLFGIPDVRGEINFSELPVGNIYELKFVDRR